LSISPASATRMPCRSLLPRPRGRARAVSQANWDRCPKARWRLLRPAKSVPSAADRCRSSAPTAWRRAGSGVAEDQHFGPHRQPNSGGRRGMIDASASPGFHLGFRACSSSPLARSCSVALAHVPRAKMREVALMLKAMQAQESRQAAEAKAAAVVAELERMKRRCCKLYTLTPDRSSYDVVTLNGAGGRFRFCLLFSRSNQELSKRTPANGYESDTRKRAKRSAAGVTTNKLASF
jgi:hypothetical protein